MSSEISWSTYSKAIVDIVSPKQGTLRIHPAPKGEVGTWPSEFSAPVFVLTAWNPHSEQLDLNTNQVRQEEMELELRQLGRNFCHAIGRDLDSDYYEEGIAVSGLTERDAISLGARYGQDAIYCWTPAAWSILSCVDARCHEQGWRYKELKAT